MRVNRSADEPRSVNDYYANPGVRARMIEYLGGDSAGKPTCLYLTSGDADASRHRSPRPQAQREVSQERIQRTALPSRGVSRLHEHRP